MLIGNPDKRLLLPQGARVKWDHPLFSGASQVVLWHPSMGLRRYSGVKSSLGEWQRTSGGVMIPGYVSSAGANYAHVAPVITSRHTLIYGALGAYETGYGFTTDDASNIYAGFTNVKDGQVIFGSGAGAGSTHRRTYTWSAAPTAIATAIVPGSTIALTPTVFIDGRAVTAAYASGTGASYGWGTGSYYYGVGRDTSSGTNYAAGAVRLPFFYAIDRTDIPATVLEDITADPLGIFEARRIWVPVTAGGGSTITAAAGVATTSPLAGKSTAAAAITGASGAATASPITGKSTARAAITQADGVAIASALVGSGAAAGTASISPAAGVATTSALAGKSTAVAAIVAAAGVATTSALVDANAPTATAGTSGGWPMPPKRKKKRKDDELTPEVVEAVAEVPKARRTITLQELIGKKAAAQVDAAELSQAIRTLRMRKRQREDDELMMM